MTTEADALTDSSVLQPAETHGLSGVQQPTEREAERRKKNRRTFQVVHSVAETCCRL